MTRTMMGPTMETDNQTKAPPPQEQLGDSGKKEKNMKAGLAGRNIDVSINVENLATNLKSVSSDNLFMSPRQCIFRVPNILKRHNKKAYEPNALSIGPFHCNKPHLKATKKIKLKYLSDMINLRFPGEDSEKILRHFMSVIRKISKEARECYAGDIGMSLEEFEKVLVLDGCFLIELFRKYSNQSSMSDQIDPIFHVNCMYQHLRHDLILLENQIPWLVLAELFAMTSPKEETKLYPLKSQVFKFFSNCFSRKEDLLLYQEKVIPSIPSNEPENRHILDLLRNSMISRCSTEVKKNKDWTKIWQPMPSAATLQEAGIKFEKATFDFKGGSILDIKFNAGVGVLKIPPLLVDEATEPLFRNLIGFEQTLPRCDCVFTSYAMLLDNLINTTKDMEILCNEPAVIDNWLNSEDASTLFNELYHDSCVTDFFYLQLSNEVNTYCERRWPRYRTVLMRDYFKNPWTLISVIVAGILLLLTVLQTVFTITG